MNSILSWSERVSGICLGQWPWGLARGLAPISFAFLGWYKNGTKCLSSQNSRTDATGRRPLWSFLENVMGGAAHLPTRC